MQVKELEKALETIRDMYAAAGAKAPASDMESLIAVLESSGNISVSEFVKRTEEQLTGKPISISKHVDYAEELLTAKLDREKFAAILKKLKADKSVKNADLAKIGAQYTDFPRFGSLYKTRADMLKQIESSFRERRNFASKKRVIEKSAVW